MSFKLHLILDVKRSEAQKNNFQFLNISQSALQHSVLLALIYVKKYCF